MTPEAILLTIRAGFEFGTELLRYLQTPEGQAVVKKSLEDSAAWEKFWQGVGDGMPDQWETAVGLNPAVNDSAAKGLDPTYTNIEVYLNGMRPVN